VAGGHEEGRVWVGMSPPHRGWGCSVPLPVKICLNFQVTKQGFMHFYCEKLLVARNQDWGASLTPWALRVKM